jgi:hypothetical protein
MSAVLNSTALTAGDIAEGIMGGWRRYLVAEEGRLPSSAPNVYASAYHDCTRHMALALVAGDRVAEWKPEQLANFRRGKDRERNLLADLSKIGRDSNPPFEMIGGQERFTLRDRRGRIVITGKVDCRLLLDRHARPPVEVKSWHPNLTARIECFEDLLENRWTRSGAHQLLSYLYASNEEFGFLLLDRNGLPSLLPVVMNDANLDRMENFLNKATAAMDARELVEANGGLDEPGAEAVLPAFATEAKLCQSCKFFGTACNPPIAHQAAGVITDEVLIEAITAAAELKPAHARYESAWKIVKDRLRGVEQAIAPGFLVTGEWQKKTTYELPKAVKDQYKTVDPKGKFALEIIPLDSEGRPAREEDFA